MLIVLQWNSNQLVAGTDSSFSRDRTTLTIANLESEQETLKKQIGELRSALAARLNEQVSNTVLLRDINVQLEREKNAAGLVAVQGPGVVVTLNDSSHGVVAPGADANQYLVHEYDLRDVVNLLWAAGAEAIAVNDERLVATSSIYCAGSTVIVNATRLSPPYVVRAIGPAAAMDEYLHNPAFLPELRKRVKLYGLEFKVASAEKISLGAYEGSIAVKYAKPGE
jgi:uncharacterized protein YlxW (UPF0749 family)